MGIEHVIAKGACIARIKMRCLKEQKRKNLWKLNPYYILLIAIYSLFTMLLNSLEGSES